MLARSSEHQIYFLKIPYDTRRVSWGKNNDAQDLAQHSLFFLKCPRASISRELQVLLHLIHSEVKFPFGGLFLNDQTEPKVNSK